MKQEQHEVASTDNVTLCVKTWPARPSFDGDNEQRQKQALMAVIVHPYSRMGGSQFVTQGLAEYLCLRGFNVVTFDLRGAGKSTGHASFTGEPEVADVMAVCRWASEKYGQRILLVGSSAGDPTAGSALPTLPAGGPIRGHRLPLALTPTLISLPSSPSFFPSLRLLSNLLSPTAGAPIAGSALPHCPQVDLYVGVGYTFGFFSSLVFGSHYANVLTWPGPKLFIMGAKDGFTSTKTLETKAGKAVGVAKVSIVEDVGHFGLEGPAYDEEVAKRVVEFVAEQANAGAGGEGGGGGEEGAGGEEGIKESDS
ncbi:unnamed protein product [Closterium sp. Naga37s-1]|nr:unnamed protein product [Closterium sp. Naga37s-1]